MKGSCIRCPKGRILAYDRISGYVTEGVDVHMRVLRVGHKWGLGDVESLGCTI